MGSLTLQYPPMTGGSAEQQLTALRSYLMQLTDELNGADWSAQTVFQQVAQAIDAEELPEGEEKRSQLAGWASLKELIIKTADYTQKNTQSVALQLRGDYVAVSDFGVFREEMLTKIEANETGITQSYEYFAQLRTDISTDVDGKLTQYGKDVDDKLEAQSLTFEEYKQNISGELNTFTDELGNQYSSLDEYAKELSESLNTTNGNVTSLDEYAKGLGESLNTTNDNVTSLDEYAKGLGGELTTTNENLSKTDGKVSALEDETAGVNNERGEGLGTDAAGTVITVQSKQYVKTGLLYYDLLEPVYGVGVGNIKTKIDILSNGKEVTVVDKENLLLTISPDTISFWEAGKRIAYLNKGKMHFPSATLEAYDATLTGTITAAAGSSFGPWSISESSIYRTDNTWGGDGLYFGTSGLSIKSAFKVDAEGTLTATGAKVTGTIYANDLLLGSTDAEGATSYSSIKTQIKTLVDSVTELSALAEAVSIMADSSLQLSNSNGLSLYTEGVGGIQLTGANSAAYAVELSSYGALRLVGGTGTVYIQNSGNTGAVSVATDGTVSMKGTTFLWNGSEVKLGATTATAVFG